MWFLHIIKWGCRKFLIQWYGSNLHESHQSSKNSPSIPGFLEVCLTQGLISGQKKIASQHVEKLRFGPSGGTLALTWFPTWLVAPPTLSHTSPSEMKPSGRPRDKTSAWLSRREIAPPKLTIVKSILVSKTWRKKYELRKALKKNVQIWKFVPNLFGNP